MNPTELEMLLRLMSDTISDLSGAVESLMKQVEIGNQKAAALAGELAASTAASAATMEVLSRSLADTKDAALAATATAEAARAYAASSEAAVLGRLDGVCASYATQEQVSAQVFMLRSVSEDEVKRLDGLVEAVSGVAGSAVAQASAALVASAESGMKLRADTEAAISEVSASALAAVAAAQVSSKAALEKAASAEEVEKLRDECVKLVSGAKLVLERSVASVTERVDGVRQDMAAVSIAVVAVKEAVANLPAPLTLPEFAAPKDVLELQATVGAMADRLDALTVMASQAPALHVAEVQEMIKSAVAAVQPPVQEGNIGLSYRGVYLVKETYRANEAVTHSGSIWQALKDNPGKPGEAIGEWKLIVKCGSNGKDGKDGTGFVFHDGFPVGSKAKAGDTLYHNGRIWLARKTCAAPPEAAQVTSSEKWALMALVG